MEVRKQDVTNPLNGSFVLFYAVRFLFAWLRAELILHFSHKTNWCTATLQDNSCHHIHY